MESISKINEDHSLNIGFSSTENQVPQDRGQDTDKDPKQLRRIQARRQYSRKYRIKQLQYIMRLETEVKALQAEVTIAASRIKYIDLQNTLLRAENGSMKQILPAFSGELMLKEAEYEKLKRERDFLKQLHAMNQQQPELFKTKPTGNYHFVNMSLNPSKFYSFTEHPTGIPQALVMDPKLHQFGTARIMSLNPPK